jgi:prophage tail gpP-like protein
VGEPWAQFRFTATEDDPPRIQFSPGDEFVCYLGGWPVMSGVILVRQVAYDAKQHTVVLQGVSLTWYAARASIISEKSEFHGTFLQIADEVLKPTCSGWKTMGEISGLPFKDPQRPEPGENIFQFLERIGRDRNVFVVSDPYGDFLFLGDRTTPKVADLVEGENILKMQAIIKDTEPYSVYLIRASKPANDQENMGKAAQQEVDREGTAKCYSPHLTPIEHPVWSDAELKLRADHEFDFNERKVEANVTVQGWFNPLTGRRWDPLQNVYVISPMAMLDMTLTIQAVTYTQDRNGSLSLLKCVAPWNVNENNWTIGADNHHSIAGPSGESKVNSGPPTTPPTQTPHSQR